MPDLRALDAAATPGPWHEHSYGHRDVRSQVRSVGKSLRITNRQFDLGDDFEQTDLTWVHAGPDEGPTVCLTGNGPKRDANAALIVALRNALPALLDVAEAARGVVGQVSLLPAPAAKVWFDAILGLKLALAALEEPTK